jgi:hypothetical protein
MATRVTSKIFLFKVKKRGFFRSFKLFQFNELVFCRIKDKDKDKLREMSKNQTVFAKAL